MVMHARRSGLLDVDPAKEPLLFILRIFVAPLGSITDQIAHGHRGLMGLRCYRLVRCRRGLRTRSHRVAVWHRWKTSPVRSTLALPSQRRRRGYGLSRLWGPQELPRGGTLVEQMSQCLS